MGYTKQLHQQRQAQQAQQQDNAQETVTASEEAAAAQIMAEHLPLDPSQQMKMESSQGQASQSPPQQEVPIPMESQSEAPTSAVPPPPQPQSLQELSLLQQLQVQQIPQNLIHNEQQLAGGQQEQIVNRAYAVTELVPGDFLAVNCGLSVGFVQALSVLTSKALSI